MKKKNVEIIKIFQEIKIKFGIPSSKKRFGFHRNNTYLIILLCGNSLKSYKRRAPIRFCIFSSWWFCVSMCPGKWFYFSFSPEQSLCVWLFHVKYTYLSLNRFIWLWTNVPTNIHAQKRSFCSQLLRTEKKMKNCVCN